MSVHLLISCAGCVCVHAEDGGQSAPLIICLEWGEVKGRKRKDEKVDEKERNEGGL